MTDSKSGTRDKQMSLKSFVVLEIRHIPKANRYVKATQEPSERTPKGQKQNN